jgi:hypothetical protein
MLDAVDQVKISGEVDWQQVTFDVPAGTHELQWRYSKNSSLAAGEDRAWLDQVFFGTNVPVTIDPPSILIQPVSQTADAGETIVFSVSTASSYPVTYRWFFNATNLIQSGSNITGAATAQLTLANINSAMSGNYSVIVSNAGGAVSSTSARLTVNPFVDLAEAVDTLDLFLMTDGQAPWVGHTIVTHDGVDAGRSGSIADGQYSRLETMLEGPGTLSFWWKVSSEPNADLLIFTVNGAPQEWISGEVDWDQIVLHLGAGAQVLEWVYQKNGANAAGADRGWLDQLAYVRDGSSNGETNAPTGAMAIGISVVENTAYVTWDASPDKTYRVFYKDSLDDLEWTLLDGEVLLTWEVVDGMVVPDRVHATCTDTLAGQTRFYKVLEYQQ